MPKPLITRLGLDNSQYKQALRESRQATGAAASGIKEDFAAANRAVASLRPSSRMAAGLHRDDRAGRSAAAVLQPFALPAAAASAPAGKVATPQLRLDNSQYKRALRESREEGRKLAAGLQEDFASVNRAASTMLKPLVLLGGGAGAALLGKQIVSLAANMEDTRISFATMLGDVKKGDAVLQGLVGFADVTPFETDEVVATGRALLAMGESADTLIPTIRRLGDISAGTQKPLQELARIYGKAMASGKVQGEELNQLSEAGIPIVDLLAKKYKTTGAAIYKMGEQGKLGFSDLQYAIAALTNTGGRFSGLMDQLSRTFNGKWSTVVGQFKGGAVEIGAEVLPVLSAALDGLSETLVKMKSDGTFAAWGKEAARDLRALLETAAALADYVRSNGPAIAEALAFAAAPVAIMRVVSGVKALTASLAGLSAMMKYAGGNDVANIAGGSSFANLLGAKVTAVARLTRSLGGLKASLLLAQTAGLACAAAFVGWELGKTIADLTGLDKVFQNLFLDMMKVKELTDEQESKKYYDANVKGKAKDPGSFEAWDQGRKDHNALNAKKAAAAPAASGNSELQTPNSELAQSSPDAQVDALVAAKAPAVTATPISATSPAVPAPTVIPAEAATTPSSELRTPNSPEALFAPDKQAEAENLLGQLPTLNVDVAAAEAAQKAALDKYEQALASGRDRIVQLRQKRAAAQAELDALQSQASESAAMGDGGSESDAYATMNAQTKVQGLDIEIAAAEKRRSDAPEKELAAANAKLDALAKQRASIVAKLKDLAKENASPEAEAQRQELAAQEQAVAAKRAELQEQLSKTQKDIAFDDAKDALSARIDAWKQKIEGLNGKIEATKAMVESFGGSMEGGLLKTPEEIKQDQADGILKDKIAQHNQGKKVTFTPEEQKRIAEMERQRRVALNDQKRKGGLEDNINGAEGELSAMAKSRSSLARQKEVAGLQKQLGVNAQAASQVDLYRKGMMPLETVLKRVVEILDKRLPGAA